jgi:hypothetical protein
MITRLLFGEPFPWEAEPLPLCEPLPWEPEPLPPCESFASEPELSQTFTFCVTVREPDSKIFVTDLHPAFAGATKEVNTAAAAAIVKPIFLMTLSSENVLRSPAGKITQSCRHHCETGHTGAVCRSSWPRGGTQRHEPAAAPSPTLRTMPFAASASASSARRAGVSRASEARALTRANETRDPGAACAGSAMWPWARSRSRVSAADHRDSGGARLAGARVRRAHPLPTYGLGFCMAP